MEHPDQLAVPSCDEHALHVPLGQRFCRILCDHVRSIRDRARFHHCFHARIGVPLQRRADEAPKHNVPFIQDGAQVPSCRAYTRRYVTHPLVQPTGWYVSASHAAYARNRRLRALDRQPRSHPILFPGRIAKYLLEPERLEPLQRFPVDCGGHACILLVTWHGWESLDGSRVKLWVQLATCEHEQESFAEVTWLMMPSAG